MPNASTPQLFVVDGSNIATEGRSQPSLEQLNEAVLAFIDEHRDASITVVVDATFGHRIAKKEVKAFDEAVANNELVTPPAGAIGRGDAFVLSIANKAKAGVLSNDSFQEFHGDYDWLFDEGRLIGGKPVPHVGWVFVARTPVRGPKSRQAVKEAKQADKTEAKQADKTEAKQRANQRVRTKRASGDAAAVARDDDQRDEASTESKSGPKRSGRGRGRGRTSATPDAASASATADEATASAPAASSKDQINQLMPFLDFVERHPVGTSCTAQVESYASHGAYARIGDVLIYIPLRLMDDPTPRSARSVLKIGEAVTVVVVGFTPERRSIDTALPHMAGEVAAGTGPMPEIDVEAVSPPAKKAPARKAAAKKTPARKAPAKKTPAKKAPARKAAAKKTPAKKAPAKKAAAKKVPAKKSAAKKVPAKKSAAKKAPAKKAPAKKAPARKTPARKTPAKKAAP